MNTIPFPDPQDADALNDFLDGLNAGKQVHPDNKVQSAAARLHAMAHQAAPTLQEQFAGRGTGGEPMQTTTYSPPISTRTRREHENQHEPFRMNTWLSGALVAALLISMFGVALWNRPGSPDDNNLAWAPQTASPLAEEPFVWTAPISPEECPEDEVIPRYDRDNPSGVLYTKREYDQVSSQRNYEIVGSTDPKDANAVVNRMRQVQGCSLYSYALPWWTARYEYEHRTTAGRNSLQAINDQRVQASDDVASWYDDNLNLTPNEMWVYQDPDALMLDGSEVLVPQSLPNPGNAVQFADGRIGIIHSVVWYEALPNVISPHYSSNMSIFVLQDGKWMFDETLPICFGDCEAMATPVTIAVDFTYPLSAPIATPAT